MKVINTIKKFFNISFALFTCLALTLVILYRTNDIYGGMLWAWSDIEKMLVDVLIFSAISAVVVTLTDLIPKLPSLVKYIIKIALIYVAFWFWMLDGAGINGSQRMILSTIFILSYAVIALAGAVLSYVQKKLTTEEKEYSNIYSKAVSENESKKETSAKNKKA